MQIQDFLAMCLPETSNAWTAARIRQIAKKPESSTATTKHSKSQLQAKIYQLRHERANLPQHKKRKARTGSSYTKLTIFKLRQVSQNKTTCHHLPKDSSRNYKLPWDFATITRSCQNCNKCGNTKHRRGFNCPTAGVSARIAKRHGYLISTCFSANKEVQVQWAISYMRNTGPTSERKL